MSTSGEGDVSRLPSTSNTSGLIFKHSSSRSAPGPTTSTRSQDRHRALHKHLFSKTGTKRKEVTERSEGPDLGASPSPTFCNEVHTPRALALLERYQMSWSRLAELPMTEPDRIIEEFQDCGVAFCTRSQDRVWLSMLEATPLFPTFVASQAGGVLGTRRRVVFARVRLKQSRLHRPPWWFKQVGS